MKKTFKTSTKSVPRHNGKVNNFNIESHNRKMGTKVTGLAVKKNGRSKEDVIPMNDSFEDFYKD